MTFTAAAALAAMVGVVVMARAWPKPTGPRAPQPMLRPVEALEQFEARCPIERRRTLHVRFAMGGVMCLDCRSRLVTDSPLSTRKEGSDA